MKYSGIIILLLIAFSCTENQENNKRKIEVSKVPDSDKTVILGDYLSILSYFRVDVNEENEISQIQENHVNLIEMEDAILISFDGPDDMDGFGESYFIDTIEMLVQDKSYRLGILDPGFGKDILEMRRMGISEIWSLKSQNNLWTYYLVDKKIAKELNENIKAKFDPQLRGSKWLILSEIENKWVIFEECMYGTSSISFDEDMSTIYFSGGGDQIGDSIVGFSEYSNIDEGMFQSTMTLYSYLSEKEFDKIIVFDVEDEIMYFYDEQTGFSGAERYVRKENLEDYKIIKEECEDI